jgi:hypothetical protein
MCRPVFFEQGVLEAVSVKREKNSIVYPIFARQRDHMIFSGKKAGSETVVIMMMMAILFCVLICPHRAHGSLGDGANTYTASCLCHDHDTSHGCDCDAMHTHEFRDTKTPVFCASPASPNSWHAATPPSTPLLKPHHATDEQRSHTFAVRHLDTIILRV